MIAYEWLKEKYGKAISMLHSRKNGGGGANRNV